MSKPASKKEWSRLPDLNWGSKDVCGVPAMPVSNYSPPL